MPYPFLSNSQPWIQPSLAKIIPDVIIHPFHTQEKKQTPCPPIKGGTQCMRRPKGAAGAAFASPIDEVDVVDIMWKPNM